jgi:hypothetical protein
MGEEFNYSSFLDNLQSKYSGERPMDISLGQLSYLPSPTTEEYVAKGFEPSSKDVVGNESAQNFAQNGISGRNDFLEAYKAIHEMATGTRGVPLPGSSDVRLHYGAGGQQYYTADGSAREHRDISGKIVKDAPEEGFKMRSGIEGAGSQWKGPHSWEEGSDYTQAVRRATNAAAQSVLPQIRKEQESRASKMSFMGIDPKTRIMDESNLIYDYKPNGLVTGRNSQYGYGVGGPGKVMGLNEMKLKSKSLFDQ